MFLLVGVPSFGYMTLTIMTESGHVKLDQTNCHLTRLSNNSLTFPEVHMRAVLCFTISIALLQSMSPSHGF